MIKDNLINKKTSGWLHVSDDDKNNIFNFCDEYIDFMNKSKTEREAVKTIVNMLNKKGFKNINDLEKLKPNDKIYYINRDKNVFASIIGNDTIEKGINFIGAHLDSPRLDLKTNPLYEEANMAYLKTHYYGGIKKYQWTTIPLSIHGVIVKPDGEKIEICIGEDDKDPIFTITDLLPHLANEQMQKKLNKAIEGEDLNLLIGNIPIDDKEDSVKTNILNILNKKYGVSEIDFTSSEIELVPTFKAKSLGLDESMVAAYGQDDKVCSYVSIKSLLNIDNPSKTCICILSDKEEIGSVGNTGMESNALNYFISEILNKLNINKPNLIDKIYMNSKMLSADVDAGYDPIYSSVSDKNNSSYISRGVFINKYTGSGGKYQASDANAEYMAYIRKILEDNNIKYQVSELGKIDIGGGGTIAYILANKGIEVVDAGISVLSMHAPYEVTSKFDIYEAYRTYKAFWNV